MPDPVLTLISSRTVAAAADWERVRRGLRDTVGRFLHHGLLWVTIGGRGDPSGKAYGTGG